MGVVLFTFAEIFAVETHHNANVFSNVFNGKGGFNSKFSLCRGIFRQAVFVCLFKLQIFSCAKSGAILLNSNDFFD